MSVNKVNNDGSLSLVSGSTLWADSPIGSILPYGGATAPSGWFLCQGQAVSRTTYSELFTVIGTNFGAGDGSTTFNLPDMRESVPKGAGLTGHTVGAHLDADGLAVGEFLDDRIQEHTHRKNANWGNFASALFPAGCDGNTGADSITFGPVYNGRTGATTEVKSVGVNYIIKAKMCAMPSDFMNKVDEAVEEAIGEWETVPITQVVTSGRSWVELVCCKKGDLVTLSGIIALSAYSEANVIATGFPIPKAPSLTVNSTYIIVPSFVGSDSSGVNVRIDKNGNLIMYNANSVGNVYFGITYALI